ncbi:MAG: hypothetical protein RLZZ511_610 [Cyanobacteriota bacterium]
MAKLYIILRRSIQIGFRKFFSTYILALSEGLCDRVEVKF